MSELREVIESKKISLDFLIREEILSSYMLIHHLYETLRDPNICLIVDEQNQKYLSFLPFDVEIFAIASEMNSISKLHRFAYNTNEIFNIDYFFDLGDSKESAYIGQALKAKERYGFHSGFIRKLFISHLLERDENNNTDHEYLRLIKESGLITSDMLSFSGNEVDGDCEGEIFENIIFLFDGFSYRDGSALKLFQELYPDAKITLFSEDESVELSDFEIIHDYKALMTKLTGVGMCICNSPFFYGLLKYMKNKFICLEHIQKRFPFFAGDYLNINLLDNGKFEIFTNRESVPIQKDCIKDELALFYQKEG